MNTRRYCTILGIGHFCFALLICHGTFAQIEPDAGTWKTWVIPSAKEFVLAPPPDNKATDLEVKELLEQQGKRDSKSMKDVLYWNAGATGYRWQQLLTTLKGKGMPPFRESALLDIAIYDATIAAWETKYHYNRARPSVYSSQLKSLIDVPNSPAYPCEHSVAAGAATTILAYLFPHKADSLFNLARIAGQSRLIAGVQYPSDVKAGFELGKKVAEQVIRRATQDGSSSSWAGSIPTTPGLWYGKNPVGANVGSWKTWALDSSSQFRPVPPPDFSKDMQELKDYKRTLQAQSRAFFYATRDVWSEETNKKIFEYNMQHNAPRTARVHALKSIAAYDAFVACWEAKYTYWGIRPYQYDTNYKQLLDQPPFPGYPSGHATISSSTATMLTYLFPMEGKYFEHVARECAESRFEGGIHFRTDNEVGLDMGKKIGSAIIKRAMIDGADSKTKIAKK